VFGLSFHPTRCANYPALGSFAERVAVIEEGSRLKSVRSQRLFECGGAEDFPAVFSAIASRFFSLDARIRRLLGS
jgi:hypothetical protein